MKGFIKLQRSSEAEQLLIHKPNAFKLLTIMSIRAKRTDSFCINKLEIGESLLGDYKACGFTEREYRTAKKDLQKYGFATFKATNKGTIGKLVCKRIFDINEDSNDRQEDITKTDERRAGDGHATTNKECKKEKKEKNEKKPSSKNKYSDDFEEFWVHYPRKESKGDAYKSWCKLSEDDKRQARENIVFLKNDIQQKEKTYQKLPSTWLNQSCFEDESEYRKKPDDITEQYLRDLWHKVSSENQWYKEIYNALSWDPAFVEKYEKYNRLYQIGQNDHGTFTNKLLYVKQQICNSNF